MQRWVRRVENWCHSDCLSGLYSRLLEADPDSVLPVLRRWNANDALWPRRVSIVSLIHYTGKNAVFLGPDTVLPMIDNCVDDDRYYMQKAVGWVLSRNVAGLSRGDPRLCRGEPSPAAGQARSLGPSSV